MTLNAVDMEKLNRFAIIPEGILIPGVAKPETLRCATGA
jgi:hypothetical protein